MKKYILNFICFLPYLVSCQTKTEFQKLNESSPVYPYGIKYYQQMSNIKELIFNEYFSKVNVSELKPAGKCEEITRLRRPLNFDISIDSLILANISLSEELVFASSTYLIIRKGINVMWVSDMDNYCEAQSMLLRKLDIKSSCSVGSIGKELFAVLYQDKFGNEIIYLCVHKTTKDFIFKVEVFFRKRDIVN